MNLSDKKTIRKTVLKKRDSIHKKIKKEKNAAITERILRLAEFSGAKTILFYASFRSEVDTVDVIRMSLELGKHVVLPKVDKKNRRLRLYEICSTNELEGGYMGIPEPFAPEESLTTLDDIDLIIIPGTAFDEYGNRLGYGEGFYDRLLSGMKRKVPVVAAAYEEQIVKKIPVEPHDIKVDKIITDRRTIVSKKHP